MAESMVQGTSTRPHNSRMGQNIGNVNIFAEGVTVRMGDPSAQSLEEWFLDALIAGDTSIGVPIEPAEPGTCSWIFTELRSWRKKSPNHPLWISGSSGCGKSVMSWFILREKNEWISSNEETSGKIIVAGSFCDRHPSRQKPIWILRTLLYEILKQNRDLIDTKDPDFWQESGNKSQPILNLDLFESIDSLAKLLGQITDHANVSEVYLVVDGQYQQQEDAMDLEYLVNRVSSYCGKKATPRWIFSTRPNDLNRLMQNAQVIDLFERNREDIRVVAQARMKHFQHLNSAITDSFISDVVDIMTTRAGGMFLWLSLVLQSLQVTMQTLVGKPKPNVQLAGSQQETTSKDRHVSRTEDSTAASGWRPIQEMSLAIPSVVEGDILYMAIPTQTAASRVSSRVSVSVAAMHYPSPPPKSQQLKGFKCPCCYQILPNMFKEWSRWRKHLVEDLCPYTCPFPQCPRPEVLYISRESWREHLLLIHGAGYNWECLACVGTGTSNMFMSVSEFIAHNRTKHKDTISEDQIVNLQDECRKITPPNISRCPLCPWPKGEETTPDVAANLEHIGNCIHEFSLNALPWAESLATDNTDPISPGLYQIIEEWLKSTEEDVDIDIKKIEIETFHFIPTSPTTDIQDMVFIPEEYFAESAKMLSQGTWGSPLLKSDLAEERGTQLENLSIDTTEEIATDQIL